jgi:hypothetical protein
MAVQLVGRISIRAVLRLDESQVLERPLLSALFSDLLETRAEVSATSQETHSRLPINPEPGNSAAEEARDRPG